MRQGIGDRFQQDTRYHRDRLPGGTLDWNTKPETYKRYPLTAPGDSLEYRPA